MSHRGTPCCKCCLPGTLIVVVTDHNTGENSEQHAEAMANLCSFDEDQIHAYAPNIETGINYDTDPDGSTRVGLELFVRVLLTDSDRSNPSARRPLSPVCGDSSSRSLNQVFLEIDPTTNVGFDEDQDLVDLGEYQDFIDAVESRFGKSRPYASYNNPPSVPDSITDPDNYINPWPKRVVFMTADNTSVVEDFINSDESINSWRGAQESIKTLRSIYQQVARSDFENWQGCLGAPTYYSNSRIGTANINLFDAPDPVKEFVLSGNLHKQMSNDWPFSLFTSLVYTSDVYVDPEGGLSDDIRLQPTGDNTPTWALYQFLRRANQQLFSQG